MLFTCESNDFKLVALWYGKETDSRRMVGGNLSNNWN